MVSNIYRDGSRRMERTSGATWRTTLECLSLSATVFNMSILIIAGVLQSI